MKKEPWLAPPPAPPKPLHSCPAHAREQDRASVLSSRYESSWQRGQDRMKSRSRTKDGQTFCVAEDERRQRLPLLAHRGQQRRALLGRHAVSQRVLRGEQSKSQRPADSVSRMRQLSRPGAVGDNQAISSQERTRGRSQSSPNKEIPSDNEQTDTDLIEERVGRAAEQRVAAVLRAQLDRLDPCPQKATTRN